MGTNVLYIKLDRAVRSICIYIWLRTIEKRFSFRRHCRRIPLCLICRTSVNKYWHMYLTRNLIARIRTCVFVVWMLTPSCTRDLLFQVMPLSPVRRPRWKRGIQPAKSPTSGHSYTRVTGENSAPRGNLLIRGGRTQLRIWYLSMDWWASCGLVIIWIEQARHVIGNWRVKAAE
jgi:hypothetical protein